MIYLPRVRVSRKAVQQVSNYWRPKLGKLTWADVR